jgi:nucleotide-binding universal stress UspA family protein
MEKRKVLVPINGSDFGRQIFPIIARFLSPDENELIFLRVGERVTGLVGAPPRPAGVDGMVMSYDTAQDAKMAAHPIYASQERDSALAEFIAETKDEARPLEEAGFDITYDMRFGDRGEEIVNFANSHDVDMIAMTTHWRTGINRLLFGNTVQSIVPRVKVPLLMLRPEDGHDVSEN